MAEKKEKNNLVDVISGVNTSGNSSGNGLGTAGFVGNTFSNPGTTQVVETTPEKLGFTLNLQGLDGIKYNHADGSAIKYNNTDTSNVNYANNAFSYDPYGGYANQSALDNAINNILNRKDFTYDVNGDALYQQYKNQYLQNAKLSMMDTMAQASAMTGGYGSSYSQAMGNQAYQQQVSQLNNIIPELYQLAYDKYNQQTNDLYNQYSLLRGEADTDYNRWLQGYNNAFNEFTQQDNQDRYASNLELEKAQLAQSDESNRVNLEKWATELAEAQDASDVELAIKKIAQANENEASRADMQYKYDTLNSNNAKNNNTSGETSDENSGADDGYAKETVSGSKLTKGELMEKALTLQKEHPDWKLDSRTLDNWLYENGIQGDAATLFKGYLGTGDGALTSGGYRGPASVTVNGGTSVSKLLESAPPALLAAVEAASNATSPLNSPTTLKDETDKYNRFKTSITKKY